MRTLLNVIWLVLCGFWMALGYIVAGIIACLLIITIPFGIASFRIAGYALWPFGRTAIRRQNAGVMSAIGNVIWFIVAGIWLAIGHVATGILLCLTIIGIPLGIASFKMVPISLLPLGRMIAPVDLPQRTPPATT
ncbi:YccF domain-containing protein [Jatrophihabitans sp. DSM 45814]